MTAEIIPTWCVALQKYFYTPLDKITSFIERILLFFCSLAVIVSMIITTIDVVMRYGFNSPLGWSFDFVMLYMLPAAYYLAFSYAMKTGTHLSVDFFKYTLPTTLINIAYPLILLISSFFFFYIAYLLAEEMYTSFVDGDALFGSIAWLTWPTDAIIFISVLVLSIRIVLTALLYVMSRVKS